MSNRVFFTAMKFTPTNCADAEPTFGFVAGDDYAQEIVSGDESPMPADAKEFFFEILSRVPESEALDGIVEASYERGATLDDTWYDAEVLLQWRDEFESEE